MIIKNNFDNKRALPNDNNYNKIGKGSNNIEKRLEDIKNKNNNPFFKIDSDTLKDDDNEEIRDKWDFFK